MADLSQYVDFNVLLDKSGTTPVIVLSDISVYPAGTQITGVFSVTQPDGIAVSGNFITPDISIGTLVVNQCQKELRTATDGNFQNGLYPITYVVKSPGYDDTVKTKIFPLNYTPAKPTITELINPFTPSIQVIDSSNDKYAVVGFAVNSVVRMWTGVITYAGNQIAEIQSGSVLLDFNYSGSYYDADYIASLVSVATLTSNDYSWLSLKDIFSSEDDFSVYTPPTLFQLRNSLTLMYSQITDGTYCGSCGCAGSPDYASYNKAQNIFDLFVQNGQNGQNVYSLNDSVIKLQQLFFCSAIYPNKHTYLPITAYDWGTSSVIVPTAQKPIQFVSGDGKPNTPANNSVDYINIALAGQSGYGIFSQSDANYLVENIDFVYNPLGGWSWIKARRFFAAGEVYTMVF